MSPVLSSLKRFLMDISSETFNRSFNAVPAVATIVPVGPVAAITAVDVEIAACASSDKSLSFIALTISDKDFIIHSK